MNKFVIDPSARNLEVQTKIKTIRKILSDHNLTALRLRGVDWFSWATAGASSVVIMTSERGIAEVFITQQNAYILTNVIEKDRLPQEELPTGFQIFACPWQHRHLLEEFALELTRHGKIASDRPTSGEGEIPTELVKEKRRLCREEVQRYQQLGSLSSAAMTETMLLSRPDWTEFELAAAGAQCLLNRGIEPTLTLVGGAERVAIHRHPTPSFAKLGDFAMLVFCARKFGLYANLTRFVYFRKPTSKEKELHRACAQVEAAAIKASQPGAALSDVYRALNSAYKSIGRSEEIDKHHQGGTTGYLSREVVATEHTTDIMIEPFTAVAWNPSLPGAKIEDTILVSDSERIVLTHDPAWPTFEYEGLQRPDIMALD